jgi:CysZ protein
VLKAGHRFIVGFLLPLKSGELLLHHRRLWSLALAPLLINILFYLAAFFLLVRYYEEWFGLLLVPPQHWYLLAGYYVLRLLALLVIVALLLFSFVFVGTVLAAPFLERLSARVEALLFGREEPQVSFLQFIADFGRTMGHSLLCLGLLVAAFPLNFLPGLGHIAWLLLSWLLLAYNFATFAMDRRRLTFGAKWRWLLAEWAATLGFGAALFVTMAIPVVGFVLLPVATVAGTLFLRDIEGRHSA